MTITFLDCETTYQVINGKKDPSPYNPKNKLVSVAYLSLSLSNILKYYLKMSQTEIKIQFRLFYHELQPVFVKEQLQSKEEIQKILDNTSLLVCHNTKFDLAWLWESGFKYVCDIDCTMIRQYVLNRGIKKAISLEALGRQYNLSATKRADLIQEYLDKNISMENVPFEILSEYNISDIDALLCLWLEQQEELKKKENKGLIPTIKMMNEYTKVLIDMEGNGIKIDKKALRKVKKEYLKEQIVLKNKLGKMVANVMGDTPINLDSPEQLSQLIYSRKVTDKPVWKRIFNIGIEQTGTTVRQKYRTRMKEKEFVHYVKRYTCPIYRTTANQCPACQGAGKSRKINKTGEAAKKLTSCRDCNGVGIIYQQLAQIAGFKKIPRGSYETTAGGFRTSKETLEYLAQSSLGPEKEFFVGVTRLNAIETYLNTFVAGIEKAVGEDDILHQQYLQCVAATARLTSRSPNLQNQPRVHTFPIRKVFISRFDGGVLTDADQGQLEYRTAVFLANDKAGREDIKNKVDAHQVTADIIECSRQDAKPHTFKPLYGGSTGTDNERAYYKFFLEKHEDIARWHDRLQTEAITTKKIVLPSGREYAFPNAKRTKWGTSTNATQIKNYPVQGFATADIVPVWLIELWYLWQEYKPKSLLCLTTHDDGVIDTHPDELDLVRDLILESHRQIPAALKRRYDIELDTPLMIEIKRGTNLLNLETVVKEEIG
jgi:DNA polymerase I-like protein with 3'-5' exonuclease and polymerase domains